MYKFFSRAFKLFCVFIVLAVGVRITVPVWDSIIAAGEPYEVDFTQIDVTNRENAFLACPQGLCQDDSVGMESPVLDLPIATLKEQLRATAGWKRGVTLVEESEDGKRLTFLARTRVMRWPDWVDVKFIDLGNGQTTLAIYSRSVYGKKDFRFNETRVRRWIDSMKQNI